MKTPQKTDNIVGKWNFSPPYRFLIMRCVKWDKTQNEIIHVVDDAVTAYALYLHQKEQNKLKEYLFDLILCDSFHKDALSFCKSQAEKPLQEVSEEFTEA